MLHLYDDCDSVTLATNYLTLWFTNDPETHFPKPDKQTDKSQGESNNMFDKFTSQVTLRKLML